MGDIAAILAPGVNAEPARLIALRLHALHEDDRNWILGQMEPEARRALVDLLAELKQLGFSALPELRKRAKRSTAPGEAADRPMDCDAIAVIDRADAEQVWQHLRGESEAVRRCLLTAHPWRWREDLQRQQPLTPVAAARAEPGQETTARVRQALIAALARRIAADDETGDAPRIPATDHPRPSVPALRERMATRMKKALSWQR